MAAKITTLGRELVRDALPDSYKEWADKPMDKSTVVALTTELAKADPDGYVNILQKLQDIAGDTVDSYGRDAALSYKDLVPGKEVSALKAKVNKAIHDVVNDPDLTEKQKEEKIIDLGYKYTEKAQAVVKAEQDAKKSALASQINSGSRGNATQLMQLMFGNMLMKDALNRDIPYLHVDPFITGTSPMAYWASASTGRKNMYDVQAATGQAGYLGKQVTGVTHNVVIEKDDCGTTDTGVPFKASDPQNIGRVLLRPFHKHAPGEIVDAAMIAEADDDEEMILRTPMTCKCATGVCAKCNGLSETGRFPGIGDYVAMNAARSFVEKVTQAGISSRHGSGLGGKKNEDPDGDDQPVGFKALERMFKVPENFPGGAVLSPVAGPVTSIRPAAQGGNYITVGSQTLYCNPSRTFKVHVGDKVQPGDVLTNGVPNPAEVVQYKGIGYGRVYYMNKLGEVLKKLGFGVDRANMESFSRAMINKVRITSDDGYKSYLPGDVVDYNDIASDYKPRQNAVEVHPSQAVNKYLEAPVLYYNIGTKVTPDVVKNLNKYGFGKVTVSPDPPPFEPEFLRPATALQNDKNWLPRLSGERIRDSLFDAARREMTDDYNSTSYVDRIVALPFKQ